MRDELLQHIRTVDNFPEPGISFKDITPVLGNARLLRYTVDELSGPWQDQGITKVIGIESRGFILGAMIADELEAGFVPVRKPGKLPAETLSRSYDLEYGSDAVEMHVDAIGPDDIVLIHDDVIATGGTAAATAQLVIEAGGMVAGFSFFIELGFLNGRQHLPDSVVIHSLVAL